MIFRCLKDRVWLWRFTNCDVPRIRIENVNLACCVSFALSNVGQTSGRYVIIIKHRVN